MGVPVTPGHLARSWESEPSLSPSSQAHILPPSDDAVCCQGRRGHGMTKAYGPAPRPICLRGDNSAAEPRVLTHPSCSATSVCNQHPLFSVSLSGLLPTFPSGLLGWTFATVSNTRSGAGRDVNSNFPRDGQTPSRVFSFPPHPQEISGLGFVICIMGVVADARHGPGSLLTFSLSSLDSLS